MDGVYPLYPGGVSRGVNNNNNNGKLGGQDFNE